MALTKKEFSDYIKQFNFRELFNDMGWNNDKTKQPIVVDNEIYQLQAVAEKCGLKILTCEVEVLPNNETRRKLDTQIKRLFFHYILICIDKQGNQKWIIPIKKSEKREIAILDYVSHQVPEFLFQKVSDLTFSFEQEEKLTIVDVSKLVNDLFTVNSEKVTKAFYDKFKKEHGSFLQFIKGISDKANQDWYASLMLNRLMFCYFIQKKGFLDNNKNYLRDKLKACKERKGKVKFYSFYRDFLLVLFHKGLNEPTQNQDVKIEIGKIPYLNGGLFDEHELEKTHTEIDINDTAFEQLFDFFDQYEWHLDTSVTATGKDINPDVIGYIFEKYINDRANMGAYYTKEDITDYISKNCILPYLFDETKRNYPKGFNADGELWQMVKTSGDEYIYDAVKKGVEEPLPKEIEQGIKEVSKRTDWNKPATINYALPTEIWREVVDRRNRYTEVKTKIDKGEINTINDFITYNLNIRQYAQDVVENTNDPELLKHFYKALNSVTIIDPTCGSGAFLFAAMNILEPLYESCIQRMENFVAEAKKGKYDFFEKTLAQVKSPEHPNLQYFIYKSIILRNLYGVDIMKEAVEIAKLRLFLKLVATVEADYRKPNLGLEPLPDIDFNIRAGNTLVGFATEAELLRNIQVDANGQFKTGYESELKAHKEKCEIVANAFRRYKEIQLTYGDDFKEFKKAKAELNKRLKELNHELNQLLHKQASGLKYEAWLQSHQPFHWFAEFYEIVQENHGFDVIIGNPPYVEYSEKRFDYKLKDYHYMSGGNLYGYCIERAFSLKNNYSYLSLIVPISLVNMPTYNALKNKIKTNVAYFSNFSGDTHPGTLFEGVQHNLTIFIQTSSNCKSCFTTNFQRFYNDARESLFSTLKYINNPFENKLSDEISISIIKKISQKKQAGFAFVKNSTNSIFMKTTSGSHYKLFFKEPPYFSIDGKVKLSTSLKPIFFNSSLDADFFLSCFNSNLFNFYWCSLSDGRNVTKREVSSFPCFIDDEKIKKEVADISTRLQKDLIDKSKRVVYEKANGRTEYDQFLPRASKSIIDEIDTVLAKHYGFTDEELDFIINYDIKYRIGKELENEDKE